MVLRNLLKKFGISFDELKISFFCGGAERFGNPAVSSNIVCFKKQTEKSFHFRASVEQFIASRFFKQQNFVPPFPQRQKQSQRQRADQKPRRDHDVDRERARHGTKHETERDGEHVEDNDFFRAERVQNLQKNERDHGHGKRASSAVKTKELREVGNRPSSPLALDFHGVFAGIPP